MDSLDLVRAIIRETLARENALNEGVYDQGILKAVFMAGGPGSGKSYTAASLFGMPKDVKWAAGTASGLKFVNSDPAFELMLQKAGIDPASLAKMSKADFSALTTGPDSPRSIAKRMKNKAQSSYIAGRLGLVIDGTGDDFRKIKRKKLALEELGYDTYMVFVNTSLEVALERNRNRPRKLPDDLVTKIWNDVQNNLGHFQALFGQENINIVDNTEYGPVPTEIQKAIDKFISAPIKNYRGRKWVKDELQKKNSLTNRD